MKDIKWLKIYTIIMYLLIMPLALLVLFWHFYPYKVSEFKSVKVLTATVEAGKPIIYQVDYCKYMNLKARVTRAFVNGIILTLNDVTTDNETGCHVKTSVLVVPSELNSGTYRLRTMWTYSPNPIRELSYTRESNSFEVVGSDTDRQADQGK